jgi:hypothetical protein
MPGAWHLEPMPASFYKQLKPRTGRGNFGILKNCSKCIPRVAESLLRNFRT